MILPDDYIAQLGDGGWLSRIRCWLFHRRFWEYLTWGVGGSHHMHHCDYCGNDWPEQIPSTRP